MQGSSGPCYAGDRCKKLPGADHATGFDSVDKNELLGGANHPCSGQCGKHLHGLCTGMFRDASAGEDGTEWTCQECGGPWPPTAISKEASPVDFKEKVVDAQLAGLGALYSLGGKGKVVKDKSGQGDAALRAAMGPTVGKHAVGGAHIPVVERDASKKENTPGPAAGTFRASASRHFDVGDTRKELAFSPPPAGPGMHKTPGGASTSDSEDDIVALAIPEWPHVGVVVGAIASSSICAHFVRQSRYKKFKNLLDRLKGSPTRRPSAIGFFDAVVIVVNDKNATTFPTTLGLEHKGVLPSSAWNEDMQAVMSWAIKNKADLLPQILSAGPPPFILSAEQFPGSALLAKYPATLPRLPACITQDSDMPDPQIAGLPALQEVTNVHGRGKRIISQRLYSVQMGRKPWRTANGRIIIPGAATALRDTSPFCLQPDKVLPKTSTADRDRAVVQYWQQVDAQGVAFPPEPGVPVAGGVTVATSLFGVMREQRVLVPGAPAAAATAPAQGPAGPGASLQVAKGGGTCLQQDTKHWLMVHSVELGTSHAQESQEPPVPLFRGRADRLLSGEGQRPAGVAGPGSAMGQPQGGQAFGSQGDGGQQRSLWVRRGQGGAAPSAVTWQATGEAREANTVDHTTSPRSPSPSRTGAPRVVPESPGSPRGDLGAALFVGDGKPGGARLAPAPVKTVLFSLVSFLSICCV
eukprot:jgi/Mesvir1/28459/Mv15882-RA.1